MAMKRCPVCGEKYSDTYRTCPFCEEESYWEDADDSRRAPPPARGSKKSSRSSYSLITPTLIVLILIMALLLVYLLYGDKIAAKFGGGEDGTDIPGVSDPIEPNPGGADAQGGDTQGSDGETGNPDAQGPENPDAESPSNPDAAGTPGGDGVMPEGGSTPDTPAANPGGASTADTSYSVAAKLPKTLTLSKTDFTRSVSEGTVTLSVSGGSGSYTWISQNPNVATVSSSGVVTPVASGTTNILATDGTKCGICIVRVKGGSAPAPTTSSNNNTGSSGGSKLNKTDFTQSVAQGSVQLTLSGVTTAVTWSTSNSSVATVSSSGLVTPVGKGQATITASWDGQTRTCIVRVPG